MFNFFKKKDQSSLSEVLQISRKSFEAGLQSGIEMVRIAACHADDDEKLHHVADVMQATLDEFRRESDD